MVRQVALSSLNRLFKLGEDAEYFLTDANGINRSAIDVFPGGKDTGIMLPSGLGFVLHDNVLAESNTNASNSRDKWISSNLRVMAEIKEQANTKGLTLKLKAADSFPETELNHPDARVLGCNPDFNAWNLDYKHRPMVNPKPSLQGVERMRTAGGHIHIGGSKDRKFAKFIQSPLGQVLGVRYLDFFVGLPSCFLDNLDGTASRRGLYGKAGSFRPKPYGFEYRVLSPWWKQSEGHLGLIYDMVNAALRILQEEVEQFPKGTDLSNLVGACPILEEALGAGCCNRQDLQNLINYGSPEEAYCFFLAEVAQHLPDELTGKIAHTYVA